jgi:ABC-2 type transport system ATP-binding protein
MIEDFVIEVHDLRKDYGDTVAAVAGISFEVASGEVFALLGTNGAGKTTTMDVLTGFQAPTSGSVRVLGVDPFTERARIASRVGVMLQEAGFFDNLSVTETLDAWRRFTPGARPRAEALEIVGLERSSGTPVARLSGGEKRRLDLALSLLGNPDVLFLDEPTTGLDPEARRNTWGLLRELTLGGMTVVLTTHYMDEAEFLADRIAIMDRGRTVRQGSLAEITARSAATVAFRRPGLLDLAELPVLEDAEIVPDREQVRITTPDPQRTLLTLLRWADARHIELSDIQVHTGSLEDAFLEVAAIGKVAR